MARIEVYTDGSWIPGFDKRGYAGIGVWFGTGSSKNVSCPIDQERSTSQLAELLAVQLALRYCRYVADLVILSDSNYAINCLTTWYKAWQSNGWMTSKGEPVKYSELIQNILALISSRELLGYKLTFTHVRAHKGLVGNEGADKLAHGASKLLELKYHSKVHFFDRGKLSNFWLCDIIIEYISETNTYNCVEQFFQYQKARKFSDDNIAAKILSSRSQFEQKSLGGQVRNFDPSIWNRYKEEIMMVGLRAKYTQHPDLLSTLLNTGTNTIAEATEDREWGIGKRLANARKAESWSGKNLLGICLMRIRDELKG